MTDNQFLIDSAKMDLRRVVYFVGCVGKESYLKSSITFLESAHKLLCSAKLNRLQKSLAQELEEIKSHLKESFNDPTSRMQWAENILTISCRL